MSGLFITYISIECQPCSISRYLKKTIFARPGERLLTPKKNNRVVIKRICK